MIPLLIALLASSPVGGLAQDPADLIAKLASKDEVESANAREDLLRMGEAARGPIRAAAERETDGPAKRALLELGDRLDARRAVQALPGKNGDLWYSVFKDALHIGWVNLKTEEREGRLVLTDEVHVKAGEHQATIQATQSCEKNEYLSPTSLRLAIDTPEQQVSAEGEVKGDRLVVRANGETKAIKLKRNTVTDLAVLRLVSVLPTRDEYAIEVFPLVKVEAPKPARLKFQAEEAIEIDGRLIRARRYLLSDDGEDRNYWIDAQGRLLKLSTPEIHLELSDEKRAKDVDVK